MRSKYSDAGYCCHAAWLLGFLACLWQPGGAAAMPTCTNFMRKSRE